MYTKTGLPVLDRALDGGIPSNRAVLVSGGPGAGKSTLAMQFLQAGIQRGESCLFISTEQTREELAHSFAPYSFELDHEDLAVATIHATPGHTLEDDEEILTLDTLGDDPLTDGSGVAATAPENGAAADAWSNGDARGEFGQPTMTFGEYRVPFTSQHVLELLRGYAPCDRVVFDSVSGLSAMTDDSYTYRRAVLDLIRLFTDEFEATSLFTAEADEDGRRTVGSAELLRYNTHGVIELWRERVEGNFHRFLQISKMRGIDHDTRAFEMELDRDGVHLVPKFRVPTGRLHDHEFVSTGIRGLDKLCGGGLLRGETTLLEHDGRAAIETLVSSIVVETIRNDDALLLLPPLNLTPGYLNQIIADRIGSVETMLSDDRLFVLDLVGPWKECSENVFGIEEHERRLRELLGGLNFLVSWKIRRVLKQIDRRRGDRSINIVIFTEAMMQEFDPGEIRDIYHWGKTVLAGEDDSIIFIQNPVVMEESLAEFFVYDARQLLRTWSHENGLQYVKLEKSPTGHLGNTQLVEHIDYPPYVRVQRPTSNREENR